MGKSCKVVVCGQASVGKTSILEQLLYGNHVVGSEMIETQEDIYVGSIETDRGVREQVRFYDTRGLRDGAELPRHCFSCTDGYVLVYSTDSRESFQRVELLKKEIDKSKDKKEVLRRPALEAGIRRSLQPPGGRSALPAVNRQSSRSVPSPPASLLEAAVHPACGFQLRAGLLLITYLYLYLYARCHGEGWTRCSSGPSLPQMPAQNKANRSSLSGADSSSFGAQEGGHTPSGLQSELITHNFLCLLCASKVHT
ncbi:NF-kappa-B inhibitor-interacting Ras-like protein 2 isoform X1 [Saimiri boliviensis]|uniref:NF-kappa-B inhibitor-interacting Ras-like protein 2 isoform X1 n=1 Tax=Saimiri boliviensis TaxID=27679 RepID=UPI003D776209